MSGEERRNQIIHILQSSDTPISGVKLAKMLDVSRQVIVQDVALLRAKDICIHSTNRGYVIDKNQETLRVFKVIHTEEETAEELQTIIDLGGWVKDVFVYHKTYGVIRGELNIHSRYDIEQYIAELKSGKSSQLMNVTSGYHYHTVYARDEAVLDRIQELLREKGFLAKLQEYEPVNFWEES